MDPLEGKDFYPEDPKYYYYLNTGRGKKYHFAHNDHPILKNKVPSAILPKIKEKNVAARYYDLKKNIRLQEYMKDEYIKKLEPLEKIVKKLTEDSEGLIERHYYYKLDRRGNMSYYYYKDYVSLDDINFCAEAMEKETNRKRKSVV